MDRAKFTQVIRSNVLVLDGAMGSLLMARGLPEGMVPDWANLNLPDAVLEAQRDYVAAGSRVLFTNTFCATKRRLAEFGLGDRVAAINQRGVELARQAADGKALVAGDIGPSGEFIEPVGKQSFNGAYDNFREQADALNAVGVDFIVIETMSDLREMKAALLAARDVFNGIIIASMTFSEGDRTVTGVPPSVAAVVLDAMGADVIAANCSFGPDKLLSVVEEYSRFTTKPIGVWANAGLPKIVNGKTVFELTPERFAEYVPKFAEAGASLIGGCCGTTPAHIAEVAKAADGLKPGESGESGKSFLASHLRVVEIPRRGFVVVGERINPSNRKKLTEELLAGHTSIVREEAVKQAATGADIIDINVGVGGGVEAGAMTAAIAAVEASCDRPISVDSTDPDILELGVERVTGKPLLNSVTAEKEKLERLIPVAKRYGAAIVALTIDDDGIPNDVTKRVAIAEKIIDYALDAGIAVGDIFIDCLMMTAAKGNPEVTFEAVRQVRYGFGVNTILGLSNVSHGLPCREGLNAAALLYAVGNGLNTAIINPYDPEMQQAVAAARVFSGEDNGAQNYLELNVEQKINGDGFGGTLQGRFKQAVVEGYRDRINGLIGEAIEGGESPVDIIGKYLMPGLEEVGGRFQRKEVYLPNVIMAAEAVQEAFKVLEPMLEEGEGIDGGTILFATVKGDVHDIGKNIVSAVLKGYGFKVFDLGKNVETDVILNVAIDSEVDVIALSALMTTTMQEMGAVTEALRSSGISIPVMIGGAVVNEEYADSIGAYYAADATRAAELAKKIIAKEL